METSEKKACLQNSMNSLGLTDIDSGALSFAGLNKALSTVSLIYTDIRQMPEKDC